MTNSRPLKNRPIYLNKLIAFQDTEPVKVIIGIRRCGKSSLLKLMIQHLKTTGIPDDQIITMNFESFAFKDMGADDIYHYVSARALSGKRMYLFLTNYSVCPPGKKRSMPSASILTAIFMSQAQTPSCFRLNTPPFSLAVV